MALRSTLVKAVTYMAKVSLNGMSPKAKAEFRSTRATNSVIKSLQVLARRGKPLTAEQKKQILDAITASIEDVKKVLTAPAGTSVQRFTLAAEPTAPAKK